MTPPPFDGVEPRSGASKTILPSDIVGLRLERWRAMVHETSADLASLQALLDRSMAAAGSHLRSILTPERRLNASEVCSRLTGMTLLALATVTADGRPLVGPVDGVFYRGSFYFGSAPDSVKFRHIRSRPYVSATHLPGEHLAVTVHGRAVPVDARGDAAMGFRRTLLEVYVPRYGPEWEVFLDSGPVYARIDADRMFTLHMDPSDVSPVSGDPDGGTGVVDLG
jgi:nitroimidazol reductase NimA-like FMN-containing flavoprotein (pyridoxamine 5'-phosphate oxidase superfamily)